MQLASEKLSFAICLEHENISYLLIKLIFSFVLKTYIYDLKLFPKQKLAMSINLPINIFHLKHYNHKS